MIQVNFPSGIDEIGVQPLTQWDYGQKLAIYGLNLPEIIQVHFTNKVSDEAIIRIAYKQADGHSEVDIPNVLLQDKYDIQAYIYLIDDVSGQTIKKIYIPIKTRIKPAETPDVEDDAYEDIFNELVAYANAKISEYKSIGNIRVMTKAEYAALEEKEAHVIYAFSDDTTLEEIQEEFDKVNNDGEEIAKLREEFETLYDEFERRSKRKLYAHCITIYGQANNAQTGGITCQIISTSNSAFTFDILKDYLINKDFTTPNRLLPASGEIIDVDQDGYMNLKNRNGVSGIYCEENNICVVHTNWFAGDESETISVSRITFELSTELFSITDNILEVYGLWQY